ncbi:uncharacterized protein HMPREF1541_01661 [Cyphellophora europaea CBS 101466]|uniref:Hemerythrin-like domain-containing protein n=1 Tax=Cyphellophora europaea (strain CBS 101466) TaxID=1220924 RepID=W2S3J0_CYPE1|nr:uncharacterized protein HMPREF1541_01661 [Cyphellophora europaea CBS 101466]ETN42504.1 hypothetical protein HMPREF1541_01661 [Cyphellophora europaea CBS 101466]
MSSPISATAVPSASIPLSSSFTSLPSKSSARPKLKLTTQDVDNDAKPKTASASNNTRFYAHLLYVTGPERERIMARSISSSSTTSQCSRGSVHSQASSHTSTNSIHASKVPPVPPVTPASQFALSTVDTPSYVDEHWPLIATTNPDSVPSHIPRTHPAFHCASHMAQVHNLFIRCLNSIYNHSLLLSPSTTGPNNETASFLQYCRIFTSLLHHHHHVEDTYLFPAFETLLAQPGARSTTTAPQHATFLPGLATFTAYVTRTIPQEYCGLTLRNHLSRFAPGLVQHLHDEIPRILSMWRAPSPDLAKVWAVADKMGRSAGGSSLWEAPTMVLACVDREMIMDGKLCDFPHMPRPVELLARKVLSRRHADVWRFAPFGFDGVRRVVPPVQGGRRR